MRIVKFNEFINEDHKFVSKKKTGEEVSVPKDEFLKKGASDGLKNMKIDRNSDGSMVAKIVEGVDNVNIDWSIVENDMKDFYSKHPNIDVDELVEYVIFKNDLSFVEDDSEFYRIANEIIK